MLVTYGEVAKGYRGHIFFCGGIVLLGAFGFLGFLGGSRLSSCSRFTRQAVKSAQLSFHLFTLSPLRGAAIFSPFHLFTFKRRSHLFTFSPFHSFTFKGRSHLFTLSPFVSALAHRAGEELLSLRVYRLQQGR